MDLLITIDTIHLERTKKLLSEIIDNKIDLVIAARELRNLYNETGENFIPEYLGVVFDSEFDDVPTPQEYSQWNKEALNERLKKIDLYKEDMIAASSEFLEILNKNY